MSWSNELDPQQLLEARLWVARLGESDVNRWWRTDGILGEDGAFVGPRVLPKTHGTGRARIAFAVAKHACQERHPDPEAETLFHLDALIEDRLDAYLVERLDAFDWWAEILAKLETVGKEANPASTLLEAGVVTPEDLEAVKGIKLGPDNRSLPVPLNGSPQQSLRRLVAGFSRSRPSALAVPFAADKTSK